MNRRIKIAGLAGIGVPLCGLLTAIVYIVHQVPSVLDDQQRAVQAAETQQPIEVP